jgi:hypothetical protein
LSLFYNVTSGSSGTANGLRDNYLQLRQVRPVQERQFAPLLHELQTLALRGVLHAPAAAMSVL